MSAPAPVLLPFSPWPRSGGHICPTTAATPERATTIIGSENPNPTSTGKTPFAKSTTTATAACSFPTLCHKATWMSPPSDGSIPFATARATANGSAPRRYPPTISAIAPIAFVPAGSQPVDVLRASVPAPAVPVNIIVWREHVEHRAKARVGEARADARLYLVK